MATVHGVTKSQTRRSDFHFTGDTSGKEPICLRKRLRDTGSIPGSGRSPGKGHGNPLQYSCLENSTDRGAWHAILQRVAKSWTRLKGLFWNVKSSGP